MYNLSVRPLAACGTFSSGFKHSKPLHNVRGVSPLIATMILIAITIAAGLTVYTFVSGMIGTMSTTLNLNVQSIDLVQAGSNTLLAVTVQNTGNIPLTSCTVSVVGDTGTATITLGAIAPGQSASASVSNPSGFTVTVENAYPVTVTAASAGRGSFTKAFTVTCTSS